MTRTLLTILLLGVAGTVSACSDGADPLAPRPLAAVSESADRAAAPGNASIDVDDVEDVDDALQRLVPALPGGPAASRLRGALERLRAARLAGDAPGARRHVAEASALVGALSSELGPDAWADLGALEQLLATQP